MNDIEEWDLNPEDQRHSNPDQTHHNLIRNGATAARPSSSPTASGSS